MLLTAIIGLVILQIIWRLSSLAKNYLAARKVGLPIVVIPFDWQDPVWLVFGPFFARIRWFPFGGWYDHSMLDSVIDNRFRVHDKIGLAYTVVSPNAVDVTVADADACEEVIRDYKVWQRPQVLYDMFNTMGKGLASSDGEEWGRHRKVVSHGFKESTNKQVYKIAKQQALQWLAKDLDKQTLADVRNATNRISMNVMMHAIFGQTYDFDQGGLAGIPAGYTRSFSAALNYMIQYIILDLVATMVNLPAWLKFGPFKELDIMRQNLYKHFAASLENKDSELIKSMIEANEAEKQGTSRKFLNESELYGNMFILNLAGFETTAYVMLFTCANLAQHPRYQDWARTDIESYMDTLSAVRLRALIYETVRVQTILPALTRVSTETRTLKIAGEDRTIPAGVWVSANFTGVHYNPQTWGKDAAQWRPDRWIKIVDGQEVLRQDVPFFGWSVGPRFCPGKKFSHVEATTVLAEVLARYRLEAEPGLGHALETFTWNVTPRFRAPASTGIRFCKL